MTLSRTQAIAQQFDNASDYDSVSLVQKESAQMLVNFLQNFITQHHISHPSTILEIGCGTGHLTEKLIALYPKAQHIASDISPQMLRRTEQKIKKGKYPKADILFHLMDGETLSPPPPLEKVSLITSNLCIQWFPDLATTLTRFAEHLAPGGMICVTTLARNSFQEWHLICEKSSVSCGIPEYASLPELDASWPACGKGQWFMEEIKESVPSSRTFLRNLKKIGASLPRSDHNPLSVSALKKAMALFDKTYNEVTYQVAFGLFRKDFS